MPYKSEAQRKFLHARHPEIAARWDAEAKKKKVSKAKKDWAVGLTTAAVGGAVANQVPPIKIKRKKKGQVRKMSAPVSTDPYFNHQAAQKAYDLVMKMDDDTAEMFCHIVVSDLFEETVEKNLRTLQRHLDQTIAKQLTDLKQAHLRLVAKGYDSDEAIKIAQAITLIEKASEDNPWDPKAHPRGGENPGWFRAKITQNQTKPMHDKTAETLLGTKTPKKHGDEELSSEARTRFQDEYRQVADFLSAVDQSTGSRGNTEVLMHWRDTAGRNFTTRHAGTKPPKDDLADPSTRLVGIEARPTTLTAGGAAFGLSTALGRPMSAGGVQTVDRLDTGASKFSDAWLAAGDDKNTNARLYGRLKASGELVSQLPGPKAKVAGQFAQIIGSHGPEAEAVLGPTARKTAYRYRGTEKTPDRNLVRAYNDSITQGKKYGLEPEPDEEIRRSAGRGTSHGSMRAAGSRTSVGRPEPREGAVPAVHRMAESRKEVEDRAPTWHERELGRQVVVQALRNKMPNKRLYQLQLAAGNTPPSEGVVLNAQGQIASQAVGYGDDHYLPFNLKHLKALKGGEYVRTRSVGGLTAEDIYTGLISGARQVTVTSRSGTYTMTFEQDFRGGRRHNDKARRMTRRYEQLLDAVQSQQVERGEIDPEMRLAIETEVKDEMSGPGWRRGDIQEAVRERIEEFKENPYISEQDEKRADVIINARAAGASEKERAKIRAQVYDDLMDQKETRFRLNSEGYRAALDSLAEQFPYYIKTKYAPPRDAEQKVGTEQDLGYVEPGRNRPSAAAAGLFGGAKTPQYSRMGGKFSAREADYQGSRGKLRATEGATAAAGTAADSTKDVHAERREANAEAKMEYSVIETAADLQRYANTTLDAESLVDPINSEVLGMTPDDLRNPANMKKFSDWAEKFTNHAVFKDLALKRKWQTAVGHRERKPFDRENITIFARQPNTFPEPPYKLGADANERNREIDRIDRKAKRGVVSNLPYSQLSSDAEYEAEHRALVQMYNNLKANPTRLDNDDLKDVGVDPRSPGLGEGKNSLRQNPDRILDQIEYLQRSRALMSQLTEKERASRPKPGITQTVNPTPTSEEQAKQQENVDSSIRWGKKVLNETEDLRTRINQKLGEPGVNDSHRQALVLALDKLPDEAATERIQNAVAVWDSNRDTLRTPDDFAAFNETMKADVDELMKASAALPNMREHVEILLNPPKKGG